MEEKFHKHSGKVSFGISILLIIILDVIKILTFDSVMPYLVGISLWAVIWNLFEGMRTFHKTISNVPAILISVVISLDLCVENFLQFPFTVIAFFKFILTCMIIFILVRYLCFDIPTEKNIKTVHIIGSILFGIFSCAGNYAVFESIAMPLTDPVRFFLLCMLSVCSWTILFSSALNAFHHITGRIDFIKECTKEDVNCLRCIFVWGFSFIVCMICYLPYLLTYYPGVIEYDSWMQIR